MCQFITQCIFLISSSDYSYLPHFHFSHGGEIFLGEIMLRKLINMLTWQTVKWNFCETEFINHLINLILKPSLDLLLRWELVLFFSRFISTTNGIKLRDRVKDVEQNQEPPPQSLPQTIVHHCSNPERTFFLLMNYNKT